MRDVDLRVSVEITGIDEDVAEKAFRGAVDTLRSINRGIDLSVLTEPHADTRGIFGMFILHEDNVEPFTANQKKELAKAVKSVITSKISPAIKASINVQVNKEPGE